MYFVGLVFCFSTPSNCIVTVGQHSNSNMNTHTALSALGALLVCLMAVNGQRQAHCCQEYCYNLDTERVQAAHFGSKTAYQIVKGTQSGRFNDTKYLVPSELCVCIVRDCERDSMVSFIFLIFFCYCCALDCSPTKIWLYARHGTRLPNIEEQAEFRGLDQLRDEILANYFKRHSKPDYGAMCEDDLNLLKNWRWNRNISDNYALYLTVDGWNELKFLAIRLQRSFPNILEKDYDPQKFYFQFTPKQRTEGSYKAFVEGLFGEGAHNNIHTPDSTNDSLLRVNKLSTNL